MIEQAPVAAVYDHRLRPSAPAAPLQGSCAPSSVLRSLSAAFTLLELLTVIAIIAILTGIVIGVGRRASESGKVSRTKAELAVLGAALESYKRTYGDYPQVLSDSLAMDTNSGSTLFAALNGQRGPALSAANFATQQRVLLEKARFALANPTAAETAPNYLVDPWGNPYHYAYTAAASGWRSPSFILFSTGPDGSVTLPTPVDGIITSAYEAVQQGGQAVNADNIYANR